MHFFSPILIYIYVSRYFFLIMEKNGVPCCQTVMWNCDFDGCFRLPRSYIFLFIYFKKGITHEPTSLSRGLFLRKFEKNIFWARCYEIGPSMGLIPAGCSWEDHMERRRHLGLWARFLFSNWWDCWRKSALPACSWNLASYVACSKITSSFQDQYK